MSITTAPQLGQRDPVLIGLCGRAGSGKDEAAAHLVQSYGFMRTAFADAIKDMLDAHLDTVGLDYAYLHERHLKELPIPRLGVSAREWMQRLGDLGRDIHPDYWVRAAASTLGLHGDGPRVPMHDRIVIADVRFQNESDWIQAQGGVLIRLHREQAHAVRAHCSEAHVGALPAHIEIHNHGPTLLGLHTLLDGAMAELGIEQAQQSMEF